MGKRKRDLATARVGQWQRKERPSCKFGHLYDSDNTGWKLNKKGYLCRECKECAKQRMQRKRLNPDFRANQAANMARWRKNKGPEYNVHIRAERRLKKEWLDSLKIKCSRCPETHVACLEFHHRDPREKDFLLSIGVAKYSLKKLRVEVDKCEIICSNCHRKLHWDEKQARKGRELDGRDIRQASPDLQPRASGVIGDVRRRA